ncbi:hypothetical protein F3B42_14270 [Bacteroides ovatus]|jgi:hypothetical protein|nr:hypothetical protein F3B42_14270 [Bacteroides ovatus]KAA4680747.1 hypothetical protein F3B41_15560 [Bacteroides ovatus]
MGVKMTTPMAGIDALFASEAVKNDKLVIQALSNLGDMCIAEARDRAEEDSWFNQTGNLRSSIGYIVVVHGQVVKKTGFETVLNGFEGSKIGEELAEELAGKYSNGYTLIVVAGMNYAEYVEAKNGKSVLASAELLAHSEFYNVMEKLKSQSVR